MEHCQERPNRSDIHLSMEEESRLEAETRDHFEGLAPKRHSKPQRSDYSSSYLDANTTTRVIPEYFEFRRLEGQEEKIAYSSGQAAEEFVETEYYTDLNRVDKQHHTVCIQIHTQIMVTQPPMTGYQILQSRSTNCSNMASRSNSF